MKKTSAALPTLRSAPRFIRYPEVQQRTGLSKTTIWRRVRDGSFSKPVHLSHGVVAWLEDEVVAWIDARIAERDAS